ncbi:hypothetical protein JW962_01785 [Candidatus Dojkabacteria bacterium]|nr:hypothetical protein [Candidatus Dojkabacteria bacterium]
MEFKTIISAIKLPTKDFVTWWYYTVPINILKHSKIIILKITEFINPHEGFAILKTQGSGIILRIVIILINILTYAIDALVFFVGIVCVIAWTTLPIINILLLVLSPITNG